MFPSLTSFLHFFIFALVAGIWLLWIEIGVNPVDLVATYVPILVGKGVIGTDEAHTGQAVELVGIETTVLD